ncbi:hypothetical protein Pmani_012869 [Petrolisthes manimaculis]|uniref:Uncharacterized protein n=1 Tax=Petrolisthes manimaculis TaxID=1843537 RepID=A0AAE1PWD8_9EUCA|nr:hypothetical protein Pmani_012869 [Petrolisthes manimaculis]
MGIPDLLIVVDNLSLAHTIIDKRCNQQPDCACQPASLTSYSLSQLARQPASYSLRQPANLPHLPQPQPANLPPAPTASANQPGICLTSYSLSESKCLTSYSSSQPANLPHLQPQPQTTSSPHLSAHYCHTNQAMGLTTKHTGVIITRGGSLHISSHRFYKAVYTRYLFTLLMLRHSS